MPFGKLKFTIAHHGSMTPDNTYAGEPAGVILTIDGKSLYHTGDTGLFYDMKLIGEMTPLDYMLLPIGDNFTMGITDAVKAVELANPKTGHPHALQYLSGHQSRSAGIQKRGGEYR